MAFKNDRYLSIHSLKLNQVPESSSDPAVDWNAVLVKVNVPQSLTFKPETIIGKSKSTNKNTHLYHAILHTVYVLCI